MSGCTLKLHVYILCSIVITRRVTVVVMLKVVMQGSFAITGYVKSTGNKYSRCGMNVVFCTKPILLCSCRVSQNL